MLYKLGQTNGIFDSLSPVPFQSLPKEKHLEDLLARNLLVTLFENNQLMPIFQERCLQEEADIYALNKAGDLVIFELKRDDAGGCAVYQALRYCERAAHWPFEHLQGMYLKYPAAAGKDLQEEHRISFDLPAPLDKSAFNARHDTHRGQCWKQTSVHRSPSSFILNVSPTHLSKIRDLRVRTLCFSLSGDLEEAGPQFSKQLGSGYSS